MVIWSSKGAEKTVQPHKLLTLTYWKCTADNLVSFMKYEDGIENIAELSYSLECVAS